MPVGRLGSLGTALLLGLLLPGLLRATAEWGEERPGAQESKATSAGQSRVEGVQDSKATSPDPRPEKPGVCPRLQMDLNCTEKEECLLDGDCEGNLKCCQSSCGTICSLPNEKVGTCPSVDLPLLGLCENQCEEDSQCSGLMKCCRNGCGMVTCTIPKL